MTLWKIFLIAILATLITYVSAAYLVIKVVDDIDNGGGLKAVVERIWEGNKK